MRRQLVVVFGAISLMVAIAFVVPLAFLVRSTAQDRAMDAARADAAAIVPALVADSTRSQIESAVGATRAGREGRLTVYSSSGWTVGPFVDVTPRVDDALRNGASSVSDVSGGVELVTAVATGPAELSALRVFVPDDALHRGERTALAALAGVAVTLVGLSVLVADRLARSIVEPAQHLAVAARRLGDGDLGTRVDPAGPPELVELSGAFNSLGAQVSTMLEHERELVAELSHRLRTPLTKLRMRVDQVDDPALADELRGDVDDVTLAVNALISEARGSLDTGPDSCDVAEVLAERLDFWSVLAEDTDRQWTFERGQAPALIRISRASFEAAIDVLIENVFSHTIDGTPFTVGYRSTSDAVRIWVGDGGDGLDEAAPERGRSGSGSTGLGIDIARSTALAAGGQFDVTASPLGGAELAMVLPLHPVRGA